MNTIWKKSLRSMACSIAVLLLLTASLAFAQDQQNGDSSAPAQQQSTTPATGWRQFSGQTPTPPADPPGQANSQNPYQPYGTSNNIQTPSAPAQNPVAPPEVPLAPPPSSGIPSRLVVQRGAYITVRIDQMLSSNKNVPGDAFTATLEQPLVADGLVVAARGETLGGRVVEAKKAGRIKGVSRLAVQLTNLSLVDGRQAPIQTQFINEVGPTSKGRDAGSIATTTGLGAAVGAAVNGGIGAAVGAGAGAIAGTVGVLLTRGHPTVIYPESELTFRLESPVVVSTAKDPDAFHYVVEDAYAQESAVQKPAPPPPSLCNGYGCPPPPYYYYGAPYYPYYGFFGPAFYFGPRFYGGFRR